MLVRIDECDDVHIEDVKFTGSCSWCAHLRFSDNIRISNVFIDNRRQDGFNIESCTDVTITNCNLICGDDGFALTTSRIDKPMRNVTISNSIVTTRWSAIRMGPLSKGNFENITVTNCVFHECNGGGIKLGMFEGAEIRNCTFSNLVMDRCCVPVAMFIDQWTDIGGTTGRQGLMPVGGIHDLLFSNIRAIGYNYPVCEEMRAKWGMSDWRSHPDLNFTIFLHGHPEADIRNIFFDNLYVSFEGGGTGEMAKRRDIVDMDAFGPEDYGYWTDGKSCWGTVPSYGIYARHVKGLRMNQVKFDLEHEDLRPPVFCRDCEDLNFNRFEAKREQGLPAVVAMDCNDVSVTQYLGSGAALISGEGECHGLYSDFLVPQEQ